MFNSDVTKLTIFIKKLPLQGKKLGNETKILGNDSENLGNNISTTNIIDNLKFKEDVKSNLKTLHNYFKDEVFRNVNNQEWFKINKNTAARYIKPLFITINHIIAFLVEFYTFVN